MSLRAARTSIRRGLPCIMQYNDAALYAHRLDGGETLETIRE
jgi:hypothetical protein